MEIITQLLVLLLLARVLGELAARFEQPNSVGEIVAGIVVAAIAVAVGDKFPFLGELANGETLALVANAAIFFLVLMAGIEMRPSDLVAHSGRSFVVAAGGMILPLVGGYALGWVFLPESDAKQALSLLIGIAMAISSIAATIKIFGEFNLLRTPVGETVVAAAIFDDVFGLMLLAVLTAIIQTGHIPDLGTLLLLILKVGIFFAIVVGLGIHVYPQVSKKLRALQIASVGFGVLMVVALGYALLAEALDMHWILGAFAAGLFFEPARVGPLAYNEMKIVVTGVTIGFFGPIFFASIGLSIDLSAIAAVPGFIAALIAIAVLGKLVGAGIPARLTGLNVRDSLAVGIGMSNRGAVELVILSIAYKTGLFQKAGESSLVTEHLFSALVVMAVVTTLITPIILRRILRP